MDPGLRWFSFSCCLHLECVVLFLAIKYIIYRTDLNKTILQARIQASRHSVMVTLARKRQSWDLNPGHLIPTLLPVA